ncbi:hypothetical protein [Thalassobius sp. Cn5-15]|uniref:hypothetical protein n=1 Tax=Thalassobius sp. Cn5-15 TaxID=2917763 RepID=UPI001EF192FE|nr:hypothetical protein [Thalassobius sp. Cn5-15]MCG7494105.1 hypothetical protein [Thalassobius sp. Cn5-15]
MRLIWSVVLVFITTGAFAEDADLRAETPRLDSHLAEWGANSLGDAERAFAHHMRFTPAPHRGALIDAFLAMPSKKQKIVVSAFYDMRGAKDVAGLEFAKRMQMPDPALIDRILNEARANGADLDWDIPAFEQALTEVWTEGDTGSQTLRDLADFAPVSINELPLWRKYTQSLIQKKISQQRLAESEAQLAESENRLKSIRQAIRAGDQLIQSLQSLEGQ